MNLVHMKSLQGQTKNKTQKSLSNHQRHNYSQICSCPTLKVLRLIGQWMMVYTIDSLNGAWSVRTFWSVSLPCYQKRQCEKVIAWSADFGMDQYVPWNLSTDQLMLYTIWERFEEFCKPQSNEVRARFDLLISFLQGTSQLMNGTMHYKPMFLWLSTTQK